MQQKDVSHRRVAEDKDPADDETLNATLAVALKDPEWLLTTSSENPMANASEAETELEMAEAFADGR